MTAKTNKLDKARRFAAFYVNGPDHLRGSWGACNLALKTNFAEDDEDVRRFILEEGGTLPVVAKTKRSKIATAGEAPEWIKQLEAAEPSTHDEWCQLAKQLKPVYAAIAAGALNASAAQASVLRNVYDRCYGKVQEKQSDKKPASGVLILPMLGEGAAAMICPRCGFELTGEHDKG